MSSGGVLVRRVTLRNPFRIDHLSWFSRLHRTAFRPRRRTSKRLVGRPAKKLFRLAFALGLGRQGSAFSVEVAGQHRRVAFAPRNTQFGALYMPQSRPIYEPETSALLDLLVDDDAVFYDIGANWGYYAVLIASRPGFAGRVEAFEPFPANHADLKRTVAQAGLEAVIGCHDVALSDAEGSATMGAWDGLQSGLARLGAAGETGAARHPVALRRLDSLDLPPPDVVKIDAEDHEEAVLRGAKAVLEGARPLVVFENWRHPEAPRLTIGPLEVLGEHGYRLFVVGWRREGEPDALVPDLPDPDAVQADLALVPFVPQARFFLPQQLNILAVPAEKLDALQQRFA